jgi:hypothetical protein
LLGLAGIAQATNWEIINAPAEVHIAAGLTGIGAVHGVDLALKPVVKNEFYRDLGAFVVAPYALAYLSNRRPISESEHILKDGAVSAAWYASLRLIDYSFRDNPKARTIFRVTATAVVVAAVASQTHRAK